MSFANDRNKDVLLSKEKFRRVNEKVSDVTMKDNTHMYMWENHYIILKLKEYNSASSTIP